jgi:hypothetical protein
MSILYNKIGFESIEKLKEYGKFIGKNYTGENINDCYSLIFESDINIEIKRREPFQHLSAGTDKKVISKPKPNVWIFSYNLIIGSNIAGGNKESKFKILLDPKPPMNDSELKARCILQITPIHNNYNPDEQITVNIIEYYFANAILTLILNTTCTTSAKSTQWWNNSLSAHLTISIQEKEIETILIYTKNNL